MAPRAGGVTLAIWRRQGKAGGPGAVNVAAHLGRRTHRTAAHASRNCFFMTLPLALRGNGSAVNATVSGTL